MEVVRQIIDYPFLGGQKGSLTLQERKKALIGQTGYKEVKEQLRAEAETTLAARKEQSELEQNRYRRQYHEFGTYEKTDASHAHDVWSIDYVTVLLYGMYFKLCVVYDIYSQAYLAIEASEDSTADIAIRAVKNACIYSGNKPGKCLLSDNGKPFVCYDYGVLLEKLKICGKQIPPGEPWHNGALESGNRDLKKVIYTIAFHHASQDLSITRRGVTRERVLTSLQEYCVEAQTIINKHIVRPKFNVTPWSVLQGEVNEKNRKTNQYIADKRKERKQRMERLKAQGGSKKKRIEDKVKAAWIQLAKKMTIDEIYAFCELINGRVKAITV